MQEEGNRTPHHRAGMVTGCLDTVDDGLYHLRAPPIAVFVYPPDGLKLQRDVDPVRPYELGRAPDQQASGPVVLAVERLVSRGGEPGGGAVGEVGVGLPEIRSVA